MHEMICPTAAVMERESFCPQSLLQAPRSFPHRLQVCQDSMTARLGHAPEVLTGSLSGSNVVCTNTGLTFQGAWQITPARAQSIWLADVMVFSIPSGQHGLDSCSCCD